MSNYGPHTEDSPVIYTPEGLELKKCLDPVYFITNYVKVLHFTDGLVPLIPKPQQLEMIDGYENHYHNVVNHESQSGESRLTMAYLLWYTMFHSDKTVMVLSTKDEAAKDLLEIARTAYDNIPNGILKLKMVENNKHCITFDNGSRIIARATTEHALKGLSLSLLYLNDFGFIKPNLQSAILHTAGPHMFTGGKTIVSSNTQHDRKDAFSELQDSLIIYKIGNEERHQKISINHIPA